MRTTVLAILATAFVSFSSAADGVEAFKARIELEAQGERPQAECALTKRHLQLD